MKQIVWSVLVGALTVLTIFGPIARAAEGDPAPGFGSGGHVAIHDFFPASSSFRVSDVVVQHDGAILVLGSETVGGVAGAFIVRLKQDGSLDATYGSGGVTRLDLVVGNEGAQAGALQPDGSLVLLADDYVARLTALGVLDPSFGTGGRTVSIFVGGQRLALQPDGRILAGGRTVLSRLRTNGQFDPSFKGAGTIQLPASVSPKGMAVDSDGFIVVAGEDFFSSAAGYFRVARLLADGSADASFGANGVQDVPLPAHIAGAEVLALAIDSSRRILIVGEVTVPCSGGTCYTLLLARVSANGSLDSAFGNDGIVSLDGGGALFGAAVAVQPDGKILLSGNGTFAPANTRAEVLLARFTDTGALDTTFGSDGVAIRDLSGANANYLGDRPNALAISPTGVVYTLAFWLPSNVSFASLSTFILRDGDDDGVPEAWDLMPAAVSFGAQTGVTPGSQATSNLVTVSGLSDGASAPVSVTNGEYALNGSTTYLRGTSWVRNDDRVNVRHVAATAGGASVSTQLIIGGLLAPNNSLTRLGTPTSATFTSTTAAASPGTLSLTAAALAIAEGAGASVLVVRRSGGFAGPVSASFGTTSGSALAGSDFIATLGTVTWSDGESADKALSVAIANDADDELDESFTVTLDGTRAILIGQALERMEGRFADPAVQNSIQEARTRLFSTRR